MRQTRRAGRKCGFLIFSWLWNSAFTLNYRDKWDRNEAIWHSTGSGNRALPSSSGSNLRLHTLHTGLTPTTNKYHVNLWLKSRPKGLCTPYLDRLNRLTSNWFQLFGSLSNAAVIYVFGGNLFFILRIHAWIA